LQFKKTRSLEPDINLIPFIDVLLVILIFLMLTTTWSKFNEMNLSLPSASNGHPSEANSTWIVSVSSQGAYAINGTPVEGRQTQDLQNALSGLNNSEGSLLIKADASATHQAVVNVLEAARSNGITKIAFATQAASQPAVNQP
jgi:biopolymer transport protein ExbD